LSKIEVATGDRPSMVLTVDQSGQPLPGQNVGAAYAVMPAMPKSVEEWLARCAPKETAT
jgi:hypothetical protein